MFKYILSIIVFVAFTATASAQSTTDSTSDAASSALNSLTMEGSTSGSASVGGSMHTAPCIVGHGFAIGATGVGIGYSSGSIETSCLARSEAEWVIKLLSMPSGLQQNAAIFHACANVESIRSTLVSLGVCVMK
jgi:hypothetical protein